MAAAFLLSALMLAPPALASSPSAPADVSWCAEGRNLSSAQRISGCSAILTRKRSTTNAQVAAHMLRGQAYAARHDYGPAIADFSAAIGLDRAYAAAYRERAGAYLATSNAARATADFSVSIRLDPDARGDFGGGVAYLQANDLDNAIATSAN